MINCLSIYSLDTGLDLISKVVHLYIIYMNPDFFSPVLKFQALVAVPDFGSKLTGLLQHLLIVVNFDGPVIADEV